MLRRNALFLLVLAFGLFPHSSITQNALSQNSGINSADTWATFDLTLQSQNVSMTLPRAAYNPATGTTSNIASVTPPPAKFHVESGYDSSGGLVMNLWPSGSQANPLTTDTSPISFIRVAGGQVTVFDQNGNALPVDMPNAGISANWPLNLLGSNPGPSILSSLVVPNIQTRATALNAALTIGSGSQTASLQCQFLPVEQRPGTMRFPGQTGLRSRYPFRSRLRRFPATSPSNSRTSTGTTTPRMTRPGRLWVQQ